MELWAELRSLRIPMLKLQAPPYLNVTEDTSNTSNKVTEVGYSI